MDLLNFSETLKTNLLVLFVAYVSTWAGSNWINKLFEQEQGSDLLSFPERVTQRARFRKPLLFLFLATCISKAWNIATGIQLFYYVIAIALLVFVTVTDFEQYVIFDSMLLPFAVSGACYTLHMQLSLSDHLAAALGGGLLFFLLTLLSKGAIGGGDIKLIAAMGLWLGVRPLFSAVAYGFMAGGVAAFLLLITKKKQRHDYFAYGPYFALSGIGILLGWLKGLI
jgi:leader peptidase (prepilin peptidase)/N-methyltransferase